ncbi:MAG TPA: hypothetical protein VIJ94_06355 [Caulobacteraceae bacterium]
MIPIDMALAMALTKMNPNAARRRGGAANSPSAPSVATFGALSPWRPAPPMRGCKMGYAE